MLERIVITIIFLISVALVSSNLAFISEQWVLALTGIALQALREQGFDVRKMCVAQVKVITSVMETSF